MAFDFTKYERAHPWQRTYCRSSEEERGNIVRCHREFPSPLLWEIILSDQLYIPLKCLGNLPVAFGFTKKGKVLTIQAVHISTTMDFGF